MAVNQLSLMLVLSKIIITKVITKVITVTFNNIFFD